MESVATTSADNITDSSKTGKSLTEPDNLKRTTKKDSGGTFKCNYCALEEHYDYKGAKPPFARAIVYSEDCYVAKDPFSLPNRGEVLVLGADCGICQKSVCLGCSLFYCKRFCRNCAVDNISRLPVQLHGKIRNLEN